MILDNIQRALIGVLIDYAEAGLDEPSFYEIRPDMIFEKEPSLAEEKTGLLANQISKTHLTNLALSKNLQSNTSILKDPVSKFDLIVSSEEVAKKAMNVQVLQKCLENFSAFNSKQGSSGMVFASGNSDSNVMVVSEPPGRVEELESVPYAGSGGELFKKIFASIGLSLTGTRSTGIYVLPSVPFRLVRGADKKPSDFDLIKPFLERHIEIISPRYLILIGKIPGTILGLSDQFRSVENNGFVGSYNGTPTIEIEGINAMIKSRERKRKTWKNLKLLKDLMDSES